MVTVMLMMISVKVITCSKATLLGEEEKAWRKWALAKGTQLRWWWLLYVGYRVCLAKGEYCLKMLVMDDGPLLCLVMNKLGGNEVKRKRLALLVVVVVVLLLLQGNLYPEFVVNGEIGKERRKRERKRS